MKKRNLLFTPLLFTLFLVGCNTVKQVETDALLSTTPVITATAAPTLTNTPTPEPTTTPASTNTPTPEPTTTPVSTPTPSLTPTPVISDPEILEAANLFSVPVDWLYELNEEVTCAEMASLLQSMLLSRTETPSNVTLSWLNDSSYAGKTICSRGQAGMYIYRLALENYHGIENAEELYLYGSYPYTISLPIYENRAGGGCPNMELRLFNEGTLPESKLAGFDIWSSSYVTAQVDMTNGKTIFDVTEDYYMRCEEPITRQEAIIACKRLYNAYLSKDLVPMSSIGVLEFTPEQLEKANQMPDASWDNLPSWNGLAFQLRDTTGYMYENDFALMQKYGFDFGRIYINEDIFEWNDGEMSIPQFWLDNLDDAMNWAIEYGVHLCILVDEEGFDGASGHTEGFYSDELTNRLIQCYTMLAKRYGALPNNVFSLNIFNEPWNMSLEEEDVYVAKAREVISAIREYGEERLIFVDGLAGSHEPIYSLAKDHVAQSKHMYGPDSLFTSGGDGKQWYIGQQWPYDYVTGYLSYAGEGYKITGNFPEGMLVQLQLNAVENSIGEFHLYADDILVDSFVVDKNNLDNTRSYLPLKNSAKELKIEWTGYCGVNVRGIALVYPQEGEHPIPMTAYGWTSKNDPSTICKNKVVQIVCEMDFMGGEEYINPVINVAEDGNYTVTHDAGKRYTYGKDYYASALEKWVAFSQKTGVAVMVQEWGPYADRYVSQEAAIGASIAGAQAMQDAGFPWCSWVPMLNTEKQDIEPLVDGTNHINVEMIQQLQPYMNEK